MKTFYCSMGSLVDMTARKGEVDWGTILRSWEGIWQMLLAFEALLVCESSCQVQCSIISGQRWSATGRP